MRQYDLAVAERHLRRALELDPNSAPYHEWLVKLHLWTGRKDQALAEARRALSISPLSPTSTAELARALLANGRCQEALAQLARIANLEPPLLRVPGIAAQCHAKDHRWQDAIVAIRPQAEAEARLFTSTGMLGYFLARSGQREEALQVLTRLTAQDVSRGVSWPLALVYLGLGDAAKAEPWLQRAVDDRQLTPLTESAPLTVELLDSLRDDPRIARIRRQVGLQNR
jgi:predicted Zn-dependent protease